MAESRDRRLEFRFIRCQDCLYPSLKPFSPAPLCPVYLSQQSIRYQRLGSQREKLEAEARDSWSRPDDSFQHHDMDRVHRDAASGATLELTADSNHLNLFF